MFVFAMQSDCSSETKHDLGLLLVALRRVCLTAEKVLDIFMPDEPPINCMEMTACERFGFKIQWCILLVSKLLLAIMRIVRRIHDYEMAKVSPA